MTQAKFPDPKPGDTLLVQVKPGNLNGRRSRAGLLFVDSAVTEVRVVAAGDADPGCVDVSGARQILQDDGLFVGIKAPPPAPAKAAAKAPTEGGAK